MYKILHQGNGVFKCKSRGRHKWTRGGQQLGLHYLEWTRFSAIHKKFGSFVHGAVLTCLYTKYYTKGTVYSSVKADAVTSGQGVDSNWKITSTQEIRVFCTRCRIVHVVYLNFWRKQNDANQGIPYIYRHLCIKIVIFMRSKVPTVLLDTNLIV